MSWLRNAAHEVVDGLLDAVLRSGWAARLAYRLGLQGSVRLRTVALRLRPTSSRPPLRVGFASDFHGGPATDPKLIAEACRTLAAARPDVLLFGGDYVSINVGHVDEVATALGSIPAPLGRFGVLGNHDYRRRRAGIVTRALELKGIEVLHNGSARLPAPHDDVWICGMDDALMGRPDADETFADADGTRLLVMHGPDGLLEVGDHRFDLALCGHTHGGQVSLPGGKPLILPAGTLNRRYSHGLFHLGGERGGPHLLVSCGVGCSGIPVRLFAWPEVHLLELT